LIEAGDRVLPVFPVKQSRYAEKALSRLGVELKLGQAVSHCNTDGVVVEGEVIPSATVLWAAGVAASPAGRWLEAKTDRAGRVYVEPDLSVAGLPNCFVIGDAAAVKNKDGEPVPGVAPAAKQQGRYVARVIRARIGQEQLPPVFHYKSSGNLATIGRKSAVIDLPLLRLSGLLAWWVWGIAHIYFLIGVRSPLTVAINWLWQYITFGRGARLITGPRSGDVVS
jgi:NADH dehydrogenase